MLPANQNIARSRIPLDHIFNTLGIVPVAAYVDRETKVRGEGRDGVVGALPLAVFITGVSGMMVCVEKGTQYQTWASAP